MAADGMAIVDEVTVHARAAVGAIRQGEGGADVREIDHVLPLALTGRAIRQAKNPLWLTPRTRHMRLIGKLAFSASMKAKLIGFQCPTFEEHLTFSRGQWAPSTPHRAKPNSPTGRPCDRAAATAATPGSQAR